MMTAARPQMMVFYALMCGLAVCFIFSNASAKAANNENAGALHDRPSVARISSASQRVQLAQVIQRTVDLPNTAGVSIEMSQDQTFSIGSNVSFRVTAKKSGYLLLIDIDSEGRMSQVFPSPELLAKVAQPTINEIRPGRPLTIPSEAAIKLGFDLLVTPPAGTATIVAILSEKRVHVIDLPDSVPNATAQRDLLNELHSWTAQLRIPDARTGRLDTTRWSFDIKRYRISAD